MPDTNFSHTQAAKQSFDLQPSMAKSRPPPKLPTPAQQPQRLRDRVTAPPRPFLDAVKLKKNSRACGLRDARLGGWFQHETSELLKGFDLTAGQTVIDVGCGDGGATAFALRCGANVVACDADHKAIESLEANLRPLHGDSLTTIVSDSDPLPVPDAIGDRVIAMEVMEHVKNPSSFMLELVRVGKPGGLYLISVPDARSELVQKKIAPPAYWREPNHIHVFSRKQFHRLVEKAGLKIERRSYHGFFWAMWWSLYWATDGDMDGSDQGPILDNWVNAWGALVASQNGVQIKQALDELMPKSQVIIASKPM